MLKGHINKSYDWMWEPLLTTQKIKAATSAIDQYSKACQSVDFDWAVRDHQCMCYRKNLFQIEVFRENTIYETGNGCRLQRPIAADNMGNVLQILLVVPVSSLWAPASKLVGLLRARVWETVHAESIPHRFGANTRQEPARLSMGHISTVLRVGLGRVLDGKNHPRTQLIKHNS